MSRARSIAVDDARAAAQSYRDGGKPFFSTVVVLGSAGGSGEVTDMLNAMHDDGWKVQSITALSQHSILIVFRATILGSTY